MGRPSQLHLEVDSHEGSIESVRVSGTSVAISSGTIPFLISRDQAGIISQGFSSSNINNRGIALLVSGCYGSDNGASPNT
jgi:hypothetical protein